MQRDTVEEDLRHGQIVLVTARWILVVAGLVFAIWNPGPVDARGANAPPMSSRIRRMALA